MVDDGMLLTQIVGAGVGATLVMDLWAWVQKQAFGARPLDYALVGRWAGHMTRGRLRHDAIAASPPVAHERLLGWGLHYATGIAFAGLVAAGWGAAWFCAPVLSPALIVGLGSIVLPFFLMQPAFGLGIAARRTTAPGIARLRSLGSHASFALGLYGAASLLAALTCPA